jgi:hypothetical protein
MNRFGLFALVALLACSRSGTAAVEPTAQPIPSAAAAGAPAAVLAPSVPTPGTAPQGPGAGLPQSFAVPALGQAELHRRFPQHPAALTSIVPMGGERTVAHGIPMTLAYFETQASPPAILEFYVRHFRAMHWSYIGLKEASQAVPHPAVSATDPNTFLQMSVMVLPGDADTGNTVFLAVADVRPEARVRQDAELPPYPGATPLTVSTLESRSSTETVAFTTPDKAEAVAAFFRENLAKQGWKETPSAIAPQPDLQTLGFVRSGSAWQVTLAAVDHATAVTAIHTGHRLEEEEAEEEP